MTKFVITPDVALAIARGEVAVAGEHQLVAPALIRSQVLSRLYEVVRRGEVATADAERQLDVIRGLRMRLLGDRVLQRVAWRLADQLGWPDTFDAEYVALTQLQADALVTLDPKMADAVKGLVTVAPVTALSG
jgi:predicted nucleic acid-binding protein